MVFEMIKAEVIASVNTYPLNPTPENGSNTYTPVMSGKNKMIGTGCSQPENCKAAEIKGLNHEPFSCSSASRSHSARLLHSV